MGTRPIVSSSVLRDTLGAVRMWGLEVKEYQEEKPQKVRDTPSIWSLAFPATPTRKAFIVKKTGSPDVPFPGDLMACLLPI
jgi:hypothetical protein